MPQTWAAGTPFVLLQAMLGLELDALRTKLYLDPALPDWLPEVKLIDLSLGQLRFDIRFWREGQETVFKVLKGNRNAVERKPVSLLCNQRLELKDSMNCNAIAMCTYPRLPFG